MVSTIGSIISCLIILTSFDVGVCQEGDDAPPSPEVHQPMYKLKDSVSIPLIGMGIGNLPWEDIPRVVNAGLHAGVLMIDTAHASNNEKILADATAEFDRDSEGGHSNTRGGKSEDLGPLHVVTKVWYTHLGYGRTKISVQDSLAHLTTSRQVYVHMLLHWPRCNDAIEWMRCAEEEKNLPQLVKDAGPPPHHNYNAFIESWKALEEIYLEHQVILKQSKSSGAVTKPILASIGVSNFELDDMKKLMESNPKVPPMIYQGNSWAVFHDPYLMNYLREHDVFFQSYGVMNGILQRRNDAPNAYNVLSGISSNLLATLYSKHPDAVITEGTVLLAYFLHSGIGVIPRAASSNHQKENSPQALALIIPYLTSDHIKQLERAIPALMKGEDLYTFISFMNALPNPHK